MKLDEFIEILQLCKVKGFDDEILFGVIHSNPKEVETINYIELHVVGQDNAESKSVNIVFKLKDK